MEKTTYKLSYQPIKGKWVIYLIVAGVLSIFMNIYFGIILLMLSLVFFSIYKKNVYNKSALCFNYAMKLMQSCDMKNAKQSLLNSIEYNKYNKEAYFFLGCLYFDEEDYTKALDYLKRGGVDEVNEPSLAFVLGRCYYHIENYDKAVEYLKSMTYENDPTLEKERLYTLGKAYLEIEEYYKSYEILEKLEKPTGEVKGTTLEYYYYLGVACYYIDKIDQAKEYINIVYKVDSEYKNVDLYVKNL
jgi:tetratricopeptide (TPR) repeat protein